VINVFRRGALLLLITLVFFPFSTFAGFEEAFILLRITKFRGNTFYPIMVNEKEDPYLDIEDIMANYLDMTEVNCNTTKIYCEGRVQPKNKLYWVNGQQLQYGSDVTEKSTLIPQDQIFVKNNRIWLHYKALGEWLPIQANWSLKLYFLSLSPNFKLKEERKRLREKRIKDDIRRRAELAKMELLSAKQPDANDKLRFEFKYRLGAIKNPKDDPYALGNYYLNADVYGGNVLLGGSGLYRDSEKTLTDPFYLYILKDQKYFHNLEAGQTYHPGSNLLLPYQSFKGVKLEKHKKLKGSGNNIFRGNAEIGTIIDLYRNNIYLETITVGQTGIYEFNETSVSGGDRITKRIYLPNGAELTETSFIAEDNALILPTNKWDASFYAGTTKYGAIQNFQYRYGILKNSTVGMHILKMPEQDKYNFMLDASARPFYGINLSGEYLKADYGADMGLRSNITFLYPNSILIEHKDISKESILKFNPTTISGKQWRIKHAAPLGRLQFTNEYEIYERSKQLNISLRYQFSMRYSLFGTFTNSSYEYAPSRNQISSGIAYSAGDTIQGQILRRWRDPGKVTNFFISYRVKEENNLRAKLTLNKPDDKKLSYYMELSRKVFDKFSVGVRVNDDYVGANIYFDDIIAPKNGPTKAEHFRTGTVSGKVVSPFKAGSKVVPLEGVELNVAGRKAVTDKNGYFKVTGA
jgi:hypothetical protein